MENAGRRGWSEQGVLSEQPGRAEFERGSEARPNANNDGPSSTQKPGGTYERGYRGAEGAQQTGELARLREPGKYETMANTLRDRSAAGTADTPRWKERNSTELVDGSEALGDTHGERLEVTGCVNTLEEAESKDRTALTDKWSTKPGLGGVVDGLSRWLDEPLDIPRVAVGTKNRVDRLKCLGNAVVPQQFFPIFKAIMEVEENL